MTFVDVMTSLKFITVVLGVPADVWVHITFSIIQTDRKIHLQTHVHENGTQNDRFSRCDCQYTQNGGNWT